MTQRTSSSSGIHGFSLVELVIVMGLVVVLGAAYAFEGRGGGSDGLALRSAQAQLASLLEVARAEAVSRQAPVRLVIHAAPPPIGDGDKYLRCLELAAESTNGGGQWVAIGEPVFLPRGIIVVPPTVPSALVKPGVAWPVGPGAIVSATAGAVDYSLDDRQIGEAYWVEFAPDGGIDPAAGKLLLATARIAGSNLPCLDNPDAVRGLRLYASGSMSWINHVDEF